MLSFFADGGATRSGWTAYPPLSMHAPGNGQDYWILAVLLVTASAVARAINFIVTIHNLRHVGCRGRECHCSSGRSSCIRGSSWP